MYFADVPKEYKTSLFIILQKFLTNIKPNSKWGPRTKYEAEKGADQEITVPGYIQSEEKKGPDAWNTQDGGVENKAFDNGDPKPLYMTHL